MPIYQGSDPTHPHSVVRPLEAVWLADVFANTSAARFRDICQMGPACLQNAPLSSDNGVCQIRYGKGRQAT